MSLCRFRYLFDVFPLYVYHLFFGDELCGRVARIGVVSVGFGADGHFLEGYVFAYCGVDFLAFFRCCGRMPCAGLLLRVVHAPGKFAHAAPGFSDCGDYPVQGQDYQPEK